jgi:hypothetical protein
MYMTAGFAAVASVCTGPTFIVGDRVQEIVVA